MVIIDAELEQAYGLGDLARRFAIIASLLLDALNPCGIAVIALADHAGPRVIRMGPGHRT